MSSGLEIVIEPDVVPKGTFDPKSLDTAPRGRGAVGSALIASAIRDEVRQAASSSDTFARATTVPPPGVTAVDDLVSPVTSEPTPDAGPTVRDLELAANAPMPKRPASATSTPPPGEPSLAGAFEGSAPFDTSIGSGTSLAFEAVRLLVVLLVLTGCLGYLWLHLTGTFEPDVAATDTVSEFPPKPTLVDVTPPETVPETVPEEPPAETAPEEPPPETAPDEPLPETAPDEPPPEEPPADAPSAEEQLAMLREVAAAAATGGEVGIEEDEPGLLETIEALRQEAVALLKNSTTLEAAAVALREILKRAPRDADALFRLGLVMHRLSKPGEAEEHYRRAAAEAPSDPRPWNNLSVLQLKSGDRTGSQASLEKALQLDPENPAVLTNLANLLTEDRPEQAHPLYDKALALDEAHGPARLGRARARERLGDAAGARADYKALIEAGSELKPEAYDGLGRLATLQSKHEQAIAYHRKAFEERGDALPGAQIELGISLTRAGHTKQAISVLEAATTANPENARAWLSLGIAYSQQSLDTPSQLYKAKQAYERSIKLRPDWHGHFNYALCAERFGNFPVAILHYEKAIDADPKAWPAYANLARLYEQANRPERALEFLDRALKSTPEAADVHLHKAHLLAQLDRNLEARASLRRFVELAPRDDERLEAIRKGLEPKPSK